MLCTHEGKLGFYEEKNPICMTAPDLIKCLKQIKYQKVLLACETISDLPSNISTMLCIYELIHPTEQPTKRTIIG